LIKTLGGIVLNTIETDRLILRGWKYDDYLDFHEFVSDDRVGQSAGCRVVKDIEESKNSIKTYILYNQSYAIVLKSENKVIGSIGMDDIVPDEELKNLKQRYIGYTLNPNYWGNGYAPEAAKILIKYLFKELDLDLVWSSHYDFNIKSKRVIEKSGFNYKFSREKTLKALGNKPVKELFYNLYKN
jgi:ribosomal-protein-alanine N-acetyltransferase